MMAKMAGKRKGRKPLFNQADVDVIRGKVIAGVSKERIAREMGVCRATVFKYLADWKRAGGGEV